MRRALAALLLVACSSSDPAPPAATVDAGVDADPALAPEIATFVADYCASFTPCCNEALSATARDRCATYGALDGRDATLDTARAARCLDAVRAEAKDPTFCVNGVQSIACFGALKKVAAVPAGEPCRQTVDCANDGDKDGVCFSDGKCRTVSRGKEGDACIATRSRLLGIGNYRAQDLLSGSAPTGAICLLVDNLYCSETTRTCKPRGVVDAACSSDDSSSDACVEGLRCTAGKCAPVTADGAPCTGGGECAAGSFCSDATKTCTPSKPEGAACVDIDCDKRAGLECEAGTCVKSSIWFGGTCEGTAALR